MKKISFNLRHDQDPTQILVPQPGTAFLPQWYRDGEKFINKDDGSLDIPSPEMRGAGMKACVPFLDGIISGYMQPLSKTIEITKNNGVDPIEFRYVEKNEFGEYVQIPDFDIVRERMGKIGHTIPRPPGFAHNHMVWVGNWGWETPRGWSVLVTHPLNRFDLPFVTLSAIMESDKFFACGNIPFFVKEGFTGIIEKGTPMFQIIPIKREKWFGYVKRKVYDSATNLLGDKARGVPWGFYRDELWEKKVYEMEK